MCVCVFGVWFIVCRPSGSDLLDCLRFRLRGAGYMVHRTHCLSLSLAQNFTECFICQFFGVFWFLLCGYTASAAGGGGGTTAAADFVFFPGSVAHLVPF